MILRVKSINGLIDQCVAVVYFAIAVYLFAAAKYFVPVILAFKFHFISPQIAVLALQDTLTDPAPTPALPDCDPSPRQASGGVQASFCR